MSTTSDGVDFSMPVLDCVMAKVKILLDSFFMDTCGIVALHHYFYPVGTALIVARLGVAKSMDLRRNYCWQTRITEASIPLVLALSPCKIKF